MYRFDFEPKRNMLLNRILPPPPHCRDGNTHVKKRIGELRISTYANSRENSRQKNIVLVPFREESCAGSKKFWREIR